MVPLPPANADQGAAAGDVRRRSALALARGDSAEAVRLLQQGCAETVLRLGPLHPRHADLLTRLAAAYSAAGQDREAASTQQQALDILIALHGSTHPHYQRAFADAALLQQRAGDYALAERRFRDACALQNGLPARRLETAQCCSRLAWLLFAQGRPEAAWAAVTEAEACRDQAIRSLLAGGTERDQQDALTGIQAGYHLWLAIALDTRWAGPAAAALVFELVQRRKLLRLHCSLSLRLQAGALQADEALGSRWSGLRRQWAGALARLRDDDAGHIRRIHDRRLALDELERRITEALAGAELAASAAADVMASALPGDTCLVEFIHFRGQRLPQTPRELPQPEAAARFAAFVLKGGEPAPVLYDLGPAEEIDRLVFRYRRLLSALAPATARGLIDETEPGPEDSPGERLRELLIDPLRAALGDSHRLLLAVDGELALLPVETLPDRGSDEYLADRYVISYLNVGREWLTRAAGAGAEAAAVFADPSFDARWRCPWDFFTAKQGSKSGGRRPRSDFAALPGSCIEGRLVASRLQARLWLGRRASKPALLGLRSPWILHIASHGYFRPPAQPGTVAGEWLAPADSPLLRAGLALAGANRGDGLLTAEEIAAMELHGTELVVLSACDSGIGETTAGEGVTGMRRAVALAGARSLVVSLWKVDDRAAALLMDRFYRHLVAGRLSRSEALAGAKAELRRLTLRELRSCWSRLAPAARTGDLAEFAGLPDDQRPFEHPFYWGAFVLSGRTDALPAGG
jgi:CHAT domain-containing protein